MTSSLFGSHCSRDLIILQNEDEDWGRHTFYAVVILSLSYLLHFSPFDQGYGSESSDEYDDSLE
jgi:hypothetical protein